MTKLRYNKKAVSPVIASVLMILVVMAGMTILFAFISVYAQSFQAGSGSSVLESLTVEDVWFRGSNTLQVWEYNTGKVDLKINSVYVNGSSVNFTPNPLPISQGAHNNMTLTLPYKVGDHFNLKVVTARGSSFEGTYSP